MVLKVTCLIAVALLSVVSLAISPRIASGDSGIRADCFCAPYGEAEPEFASYCGANMPDIKTSFDADSEPGQCDGTSAPCPKIKDCKSQVAVTLTSKPLTGLRKTGTTGTLQQTVTEIFSVNACGELDSEHYDVVDGNPASPRVGLVICHIVVRAGCPFCKDSVGGDG